MPQGVSAAVGIVAPCSVCHQEGAASELRAGVCLACRVGRETEPLFSRYVQLQRKRRRLAAVAPPGGLRGVDGQIAHCLRDAWSTIQAAMPDAAAVDRHRRAQPFMTRFLQAASEQSGPLPR